MIGGTIVSHAAKCAHSITVHWRGWVLCAVSLAPLAAALSFDPLPQDPGYHAFADRRYAAGVPNFFNVTSNAALLAVGIVGIALVLQGRVHGARIAWAALFTGAILVAFGSGYYHWSPSNVSLVWDRLPMTISVMGLFIALLSEHISEKLEQLLAPALVVGAASVVWWHHADDLRLYAWVQFTPLVVLPLLVALFPGRYTHRRFLLYGLGCYLLAKVAEALDRQTFEATAGMVSGHTLKHLLAALALFFVYLMLRRRESLPDRAGRRADPR